MHESNERLEKLFFKIPTNRLQLIYDRHGIDAPDVRNLVKEICLDGANTITSIFRGWEGVSYLEVVKDVAGKVGIKVNGEKDEAILERQILNHVLQQALEKASDEDKEAIEEVLKNMKPINWSAIGASSAAAITTLIQTVGGKVAAEALEGVIFRMLGKEMAMKSAGIIGYAVPLLNIVLIGWTIVDVAGPAFRKTIPTVVEIAMLRLEFGDKGAN